MEFADNTFYQYAGIDSSSWDVVTINIDAGTNPFQFFTTHWPNMDWPLIGKVSGPPATYDDWRPGFGSPDIPGPWPIFT
jgi:hypothetical protein